MLARVEREFRRLDARVRGRADVLFRSYGQGKSLPNEQLKGENRWPDGNGGRIQVFAFRLSATVRVYGASREIDGLETFVCSEIDSAKKKRKANQDKLRRAALNASCFFDAVVEGNSE